MVFRAICGLLGASTLLTQRILGKILRKTFPRTTGRCGRSSGRCRRPRSHRKPSMRFGCFSRKACFRVCARSSFLTTPCYRYRRRCALQRRGAFAAAPSWFTPKPVRSHRGPVARVTARVVTPGPVRAPERHLPIPTEPVTSTGLSTSTLTVLSKSRLLLCTRTGGSCPPQRMADCASPTPLGSTPRADGAVASEQRRFAQNASYSSRRIAG